MKITLALVSASVGLAVSGELGQKISKRAAEDNATTREGFLAPEAAFKFKVNCGKLSPGNCTLAKWLMINLDRR